MGLPGADDMNELVKLLVRALPGNMRFDLEKETREFLVALGVEHPDLFLHGSGRYGMGLGIAAQAAGVPLPTFDFSQRLSMGNVLPGFRELGRAFSPEGSFEQTFTSQAEDIMGAVFSIPINVGKSLADNHPDFYKRWERSMPRALRNVVKANRFATEGMERTRTGAEVVGFDVEDPLELAEIIGQGLGFSPTRLRQTWDRDIATSEAVNYWQTRRGMVLAQFDFARMIGDREGSADAKKALREFNATVPSKAMRIGGDTLKDSLVGRIRARRLQEAGVGTAQSAAPLVRGMRANYPEVSNVR